MRICAIAGIILSFLWLAGIESSLASDADKTRIATALREQAIAMERQGNHDIAEHLLKAADHLEMAPDGGKIDGDVPVADMNQHELMDRLRELLTRRAEFERGDAPEADRTEVRERIAELNSELNRRSLRTGRELGTGRKQPSAQPRAPVENPGAAVRINHLHAAVQHLQHAGAHDLARQAQEMHDRLKKEWDEELRQRWDAMSQRPHSGDQGLDQMQAIRDEIRNAHEEIQRLQAEVNELRRQVERR